MFLSYKLGYFLNKKLLKNEYFQLKFYKYYIQNLLISYTNYTKKASIEIDYNKFKILF